MANFNVHVSLTKKETFFIATITNEKGEVIKELAEEVTSLGPKFHQKIMHRRCVDWIHYDHQEPTEILGQKK